jgi:hypothetical protein
MKKIQLLLGLSFLAVFLMSSTACALLAGTDSIEYSPADVQV